MAQSDFRLLSVVILQEQQMGHVRVRVMRLLHMGQTQNLCALTTAATTAPMPVGGNGDPDVPVLVHTHVQIYP